MYCTRHIRVSTKKRLKISFKYIHIYIQNICSFLVNVQHLRLSSLPRTTPAADKNDDDDETMHRHITKLGESSKRWHQRTPGLRVLPLASLIMIVTVAFGNVVMWVIAGVVLVNTNPLFFLVFCWGMVFSLEYRWGNKEWRV